MKVLLAIIAYIILGVWILKDAISQLNKLKNKKQWTEKNK